jgi:hypothetical protein
VIKVEDKDQEYVKIVKAVIPIAKDYCELFDQSVGRLPSDPPRTMDDVLNNESVLSAAEKMLSVIIANSSAHVKADGDNADDEVSVCLNLKQYV